MDTISASDAETHLSALLDRVVKGENITITRHGLPAAVLIPVPGAVTKLSHKEVLEGMRALRQRVKPGKMSVREMIEEGRRFFDWCSRCVYGASMVLSR
ncbi:MAG TPA: type II toxin-antitoxin system prevent-host-death family antitoxin [Bryobacteraceae bacterium]|nr:type II toxin-antitoxin system prevent-host-death family antitoxin [Bryobacteraceae bacterium]